MADTVDANLTVQPAGNMSGAIFSNPDPITSAASMGFAKVDASQVVQASDLQMATPSFGGSAGASSGSVAAAGTGGSISGLVSSLGNAASDFFSAAGDKAEQADYEKAEAISVQNEAYAKESGNLAKTAAARSVFQTIGQQDAQVEGAGFKTGSGSAADLRGNSSYQGELSKQVIGVQTNVNVNGYAQQADAYKSQATAAGTAASVAGVAGATSAVSGVLGFFGL